MNPFPLAFAEFRRAPLAMAALALVVALAIGLGVAVGVLERGIRRGSAAVSDRFDLVVGAPGSATALVLASVYLRVEALPLLPGSVLGQLASDPAVAWASPIGFGDAWRGRPIVGVTGAFLDEGGRRPLAEGRPFASHDEAVAGALVPLALGAKIEPQHGAGSSQGRLSAEVQPSLAPPGLADPHGHEGVAYRITGRLAPTGSPWDHAILVPIEAVWELHGLGTGQANDDDRLGPPWDGTIPGVPAILVKPRSFADAYTLRARLRRQGLLAVFPAEVVVELHRALGDVRQILTWMSVASAGFVVASVFLAFAGRLSARRRQIAVLRAIGAPRRFVLALVWIEMALVLLVGGGLGLLLGWGAALVAAGQLAAEARSAVPVALAAPELALAGAILGASLLASLAPALAAWRRPVVEDLQRG